MIDYLEMALTAENAEDESGTMWAEDLSGNRSLFLAGKRKRSRESDFAAEETLPQGAFSAEVARVETDGAASGADSREARAKAEAESIMALSRRLSEAGRMERAMGTAAVQRKWNENAGNGETFGSFVRRERGSGELLRSAEELDRLVERDARRYGGTFSLF